tara:strand:- start:7517 stop:8116 length:600 start_codon:yes stop_codon:yes gene_type:complete
MKKMESFGYLKVIMGPMTSGKTTELIREYNRHLHCDFKCCFINHKSDIRFGSDECDFTSTHNNITVKNTTTCKNLNDFFNFYDNPYEKSEEYDIYFINECQFFKDLYDCVDWLVNSKNKRVYVCGLDGDFRRQKFGTLLDIIPLCDDVLKIKALCKECKVADAIFTYRNVENEEQFMIGDTAIYEALCRRCYNKKIGLV